MTNGGRRLPTYVPTEDAVVVERLLDAGVTITAKTNLEDLGCGSGEGSFFGAARNPYDTRFATGGSSSGSGAAVAAGMVDLALGADEAGSVRMPAAWCGVVGMKATHGLVPSYGMAYMDHTIDHIGSHDADRARQRRDARGHAGHDWRDPQWVRREPGSLPYTRARREIQGLRIGIVTEALEPAGCTHDVLEAFHRATDALRGLGAELVPVSIPLWSDAAAILLGVMSFGLHAMVGSGGAGSNHMGRIDPHYVAHTAAQRRLGATDLPPMLRTLLIVAEHLRDEYQGVHQAKAQNLRMELRHQVTATLGDADLLVTPYPDGHPDERSMLNHDPPAHTRIRRPANTVLTPKAVKALEPAVRERCDALIDAFIGDDGRCTGAIRLIPEGEASVG